jgi:hypothetical protein
MPLQSHLHGAPAWVTAWRRVVLDFSTPKFPKPRDAAGEAAELGWTGEKYTMRYRYLVEPVFTPRRYAPPYLTTLLWTATGEAGSWEHSSLVPAPGSDGDQSGADWLFELVRQPGGPGAYAEWIESYRDGGQAEDEDDDSEPGLHVDREAVASVYAHQPLTPALVTRLARDPEMSLAWVEREARAIGYPAAGTGR